VSSNPLFVRLVEVSRLSPLFAESTIARACKRAGVQPDALCRADLPTVMPEVQRAIQGFLEDDDRERVFAELDSLSGR